MEYPENFLDIRIGNNGNASRTLKLSPEIVPGIEIHHRGDQGTSLLTPRYGTHKP